jgi:hypothetical protein
MDCERIVYMSLTPMQEAFAKAGLVSKEEIEKKEKDRLKTQQEAKSKLEEDNRKIKAERAEMLKKGAKEGTLSPTQIENWRKVLCMQLGPYALIMPDSDIQKMRDKMQNWADDFKPSEDTK